MTISVANTLSRTRAEHHTERYKTTTLIVRRGQPLELETSSTTLTLRLVPAHPSNRASDLGYSFTVSLGASRSHSAGWALRPHDTAHDRRLLRIPVHAPVGLYELADDDDSIALVVLFNPFLSRDPVYIPHRSYRREYVLNDSGRIWRGSYNSFSGMPWTYAQFRPTVLLSAIDLLDAMPVDQRHDPIMVVRHLSAKLNSSDGDNGILIGNWSGDYSGGTSPTAWTGSAEILNQYWNTRRPVPYAQCWVFAGVFTSVLRTLGIPSSTISNFQSAHESTRPYNRVIEHYYSSTGRPQPRRSMGSVWNFHVWNMAWMRRPDLDQAAAQHGLDYNGWQVVDSTPQEESMGLYQLGPAPVLAIKHGFNVDYDCDFVYGEVNADIVDYWEVRGTGRYQPRRKDSRTVGQNLSMKAVGKDRRNDVTLMYKFAEGSAEERESFANRVTGAIESTRDLAGDVEFEIEGPTEVRVGDAVKVSMKMTNTGRKSANIRWNCVYRGTDYTGRAVEIFGSMRGETRVGGGDTGEVEVDMSPEEYEAVLGKGTQTIQLNWSTRVKRSGQAWSDATLVRVNGDDVLKVFGEENMELGEATTVKAVIENLTHMTLTDVVLRVEGEGLTNLQRFEVDDVESGDVVEVDVEVEPSDVGDRLLVMTLDTKELLDVARSVHVEVVDNAGNFNPWDMLWNGLHSENMEGMVDIASS